MSSLILFLSCLCFLAEGKKKKTNKARHRNKWWLIETTNNEEGGEYGMDYQDNDYSETIKTTVPTTVPTKCSKFMTISQNVMLKMYFSNVMLKMYFSKCIFQEVFFCLLITLIKCLKGHKSLELLFNVKNQKVAQ